jgi:hypothetical protein
MKTRFRPLANLRVRITLAMLALAAVGSSVFAFGIFMGAINGYLIAGTILFYMNEAQYPFPDIISAPQGNVAASVQTLMNWMPPHLLGEPGIYFAVLICFIFVIVVFI